MVEEGEKYVQTNFGYCFYGTSLIYNLYVYPQYRRQGHSRILLQRVISQIREDGYKGKIYIQAQPRENSIELSDLIWYYKSMGLTILDSNKWGIIQMEISRIQPVQPVYKAGLNPRHNTRQENKNSKKKDKNSPKSFQQTLDNIT